MRDIHQLHPAKIDLGTGNIVSLKAGTVEIRGGAYGHTTNFHVSPEAAVALAPYLGKNISFYVEVTPQDDSRTPE